MKRSIYLLIVIMFSLLFFTSCEKKELLKQRTLYGEATINGKTLYQYTTIGEAVSNKYWFLPLGLDNNIIIKEGVCYLQMFLRDYEETETENFYLILVGCYADENFPVIGKEYEIVVENKIELGNIYNSFYWSGELRDYYFHNPEFETYGIAGLSIPPSHDGFIPVEGSIQFIQTAKDGLYTISYILDNNNYVPNSSYHISGEFQGKLKVV